MSIFGDIQMVRSWKKTKNFLQSAKSQIPFSALTKLQIQTLQDFDEYIDYNELGLAFGQLEYLAETVDLPNEFWKEMLSAAKQMQMGESAERCKKHLIE